MVLHQFLSSVLTVICHACHFSSLSSVVSVIFPLCNPYCLTSVSSVVFRLHVCYLSCLSFVLSVICHVSPVCHLSCISCLSSVLSVICSVCHPSCLSSVILLFSGMPLHRDNLSLKSSSEVTKSSGLSADTFMCDWPLKLTSDNLGLALVTTWLQSDLTKGLYV